MTRARTKGSAGTPHWAAMACTKACAARGKAAAVQGNRHEKIGLGQKIVADARHPCPERFGKFHSIVVFQPMYQLPHRAILEVGDGPCAGEDRRIRDRLWR